MLRLLEPTSGEVLFDGEDVTKMGKPELKQFRNRAQIIFQDPYALSLIHILPDFLD